LANFGVATTTSSLVVHLLRITTAYKKALLFAEDIARRPRRAYATLDISALGRLLGRRRIVVRPSVTIASLLLVTLRRYNYRKITEMQERTRFLWGTRGSSRGSTAAAREIRRRNPEHREVTRRRSLVLSQERDSCVVLPRCRPKWPKAT